MPHPEAVRLGTSPHIKIGQGNPVWEIVSQKYAKRSETVSALPVRSLSKRPFLCSGPRSVHAGSLVVGSASVRPYDYRSVYLLVFLSCAGPIWDLQSFFSLFFTRCFELHLYLSVVLHLFLSVVTWSPSDENVLGTSLWVKQNLISYHYSDIFYLCCVWFYSKSPGYSVFGFWEVRVGLPLLLWFSG